MRPSRQSSRRHVNLKMKSGRNLNGSESARSVDHIWLCYSSCYLADMPSGLGFRVECECSWRAPVGGMVRAILVGRGSTRGASAVPSLALTTVAAFARGLQGNFGIGFLRRPAIYEVGWQGLDEREIQVSRISFCYAVGRGVIMQQ